MLRALAAIALILLWAGSCHADGNGDFDRYWNRFRQAVINGETDTIASMTRLPLWVRGPDDSDPVVYYDRKEFKSILNSLLNQEVSLLIGDRVICKTMLKVIKEKKQITEKDFTTASVVSVELFEFEKVNGKWLFTRGYLEAK